MNNRLLILKQMLSKLQDDVAHTQAMLEQVLNDEGEDLANYTLTETENPNVGKIIEGVFDGCYMIGPDGRNYQVPVNYASKSLLVEGDILKLTIRPDGTFVFKPIKPIERQRVNGILVKDEDNGEFRALVEKKLYKILLASVTFHKGRLGDEIVLLIPAHSPSNWAAVENIISQ